MRRAAACVLAFVFTAALLAGVLAPAPYEAQFRDSTDIGPCKRFPLGTDELGRDRLSRLLYGARVSLLLAPAAALLATAIAAAAGLAAGYCGGLPARVIMSITDLVLSLPWIFLLLAVRAVLPLNVSPAASVAITFALLGLFGWAHAARVVRAATAQASRSDWALTARALGCSRLRLLALHVLPNVRPVLAAQFWISVPAFLLAEGNLGMLGLGVAEPLPSLGNLLRELENPSVVAAHPWALAPAALLLFVLACFQTIVATEDSRV